MLRITISSSIARPTARFPSLLKSPSRPSHISIPKSLRSAPRRTLTTRPSKPTIGFTFSSHSRPSRNSTILQYLRNTTRQFHNSKPRFNTAATPEPDPTTIGGKLKKLSREYGWSALGVYAMLSVLDFPFCYMLVMALGTERIGRWEEYIVSHVKLFIPESVKQTWHDWRASMRITEHAVTGEEGVNDHIDQVEHQVKLDEKRQADGTATAPDAWGVEEAKEANKYDASLATRLALAYAIHKSFIFVRVPLTVAVTPKLVKTLRGWGWDIGKRTTKEAKALKRASMPVKKPRARWAGRFRKPKSPPAQPPKSP